MVISSSKRYKYPCHLHAVCAVQKFTGRGPFADRISLQVSVVIISHLPDNKNDWLIYFAAMIFFYQKTRIVCNKSEKYFLYMGLLKALVNNCYGYSLNQKSAAQSIYFDYGSLWILKRTLEAACSQKHFGNL